jgi:hypothetical protein
MESTAIFCTYVSVPNVEGYASQNARVTTRFKVEASTKAIRSFDAYA